MIRHHFTKQNKASVNAHLSRWFKSAPILAVAIVVELDQLVVFFFSSINTHEHCFKRTPNQTPSLGMKLALYSYHL